MNFPVRPEVLSVHQWMQRIGCRSITAKSRRAASRGYLSPTRSFRNQDQCKTSHAMTEKTSPPAHTVLGRHSMLRHQVREGTASAFATKARILQADRWVNYCQHTNTPHLHNMIIKSCGFKIGQENRPEGDQKFMAQLKLIKFCKELLEYTMVA